MVTANLESRPTARGFLLTRTGHLSLAILAVELIAGMQTFLTGTITPLLAEDLHGRHLYGVATAAAQVAVFLTMPLGAGLMQRYAPAVLLTWLTPATIVAAVIGALSTSMWAYVGSRALAGLAAGALAVVGMGAIVTGLPPAWRQLVLAAINLMWLISSMLGPLYAAWASQALGWRWAMVLYLPLLVAARWVIVRELGRVPRPESSRSRLPVGQAVRMAAGVALLSATSEGSLLGWGLGLVGMVLVGRALARLLPAGVLALRRGARSAIALIGLVTAVVFGAEAVAPILGHDALGFDAARTGVLLSSMTVSWSILGLVCASRPVQGHALQVRAGVGVAATALGVVAMAVALTAREGWAFIGGYGVAGIGIGLVYLDAMNVAFTPDEPDPIASTDSAGAVLLAEQAASALAMTATTSVVAAQPLAGPAVLGVLALLAVPALVATGRLSVAR